MEETPRALRLARKELRRWKAEMEITAGWRSSGVYVANTCLRALQKKHLEERTEISGIAANWYEKESARALREFETTGHVSDPCFKFMETK